MAGAWKEFYDSVIGYNLNYVNSIQLADYPKQFWQAFYPQFQTFWPVYLLATLGILSSFRSKSSFRILAGWLLFSVVGIAIGGYFRGHYFIQIFPAIVLLATSYLVLETSQRWPRNSVAVSAVIVGLIVAWGVWRGSWYYGTASPDEKLSRYMARTPLLSPCLQGVISLITPVLWTKSLCLGPNRRSFITQIVPAPVDIFLFIHCYGSLKILLNASGKFYQI